MCFRSNHVVILVVNDKQRQVKSQAAFMTNTKTEMLSFPIVMSPPSL